MYALLLPVCAGVLSACSEKKADARTLDGEWTIVEVNGEKLGEEVTPTMSFNMAEKKLHGNAGCNLFNTTVTLDPADVSRYDDDGMPEYGRGDEGAPVDGAGACRESGRGRGRDAAGGRDG